MQEFNLGKLGVYLVRLDDKPHMTMITDSPKAAVEFVKSLITEGGIKISAKAIHQGCGVQIDKRLMNLFGVDGERILGIQAGQLGITADEMVHHMKTIAASRLR